MKFTNPLLKGSLIQRYKRFLADIILENGEKITAHCANTGSMLGVNDPGSEVWVSPTLNPNRKENLTTLDLTHKKPYKSSFISIKL